MLRTRPQAVLAGSLVALTAWTLRAASADQAAIGEVLAGLRPASVLTTPGVSAAATAAPASTSARYAVTAEGHLRWLSAPSGYEFAADPALIGSPMAEVARRYLIQHGAAFGVASAAVDFSPLRTRTRGSRTQVKLQETYAGVPVFGAEAIVQLNTADGVECVMSRIQRDTQLLDAGAVATVPVLDAASAALEVQAHFAPLLGELVSTTPASLQIYAPELLQDSGPLRLVWKLEAQAANESRLHQQVLVDATTGEMVAGFDLNYDALNRQIQDQNNSSNTAPSVVRNEGGAATGTAQFDNAYLYLGDTYNFYSSQHNRDSYDDAGAQIIAILRWCSAKNGCPTANAFSGSGAVGSPLLFGDFWATDDVIPHEFTHKVTANESGLIYTNASGAINESLSDVWGEIIDQGNGRGTDTAAVKWQFGEDIPTGYIRSMKDPTLKNDPDRLGSPLYQQPANVADNGGVHSNSGVNNKLCYLITDGDTFNGQTIFGMGRLRVVDLYYEAQTDLLTSSADYQDLFHALLQAAVNLHWTQREQNNLLNACRAVEIDEAVGNYWVDRNSGCPNELGFATCVLSMGPHKTVSRGVTKSPAGGVLHIQSGTYPEAVTIEKALELRAENGPVTIGTP